VADALALFLFRAAEEESSGEEDDPNIEFKSMKHPGSVNRIRVMPQEPFFTCTWSEDGKLYIWDALPFLKALDVPGSKLGSYVAKLSNHTTEGFALDWSSLVKGRLVSGDCHGNILMTEMKNNAWVQEKQPYQGHEAR
jgi:ribosome assembly protein RRB1